MNEFDRTGGRCISRSLAGPLAMLFVVLTVRAQESKANGWPE